MAHGPLRNFQCCFHRSAQGSTVLGGPLSGTPGVGILIPSAPHKKHRRNSRVILLKVLLGKPGVVPQPAKITNRSIVAGITKHHRLEFSFGIVDA